MEYRMLAQTNEKLSTVGMGTWRIGSFRTKEEREGQVKALRRGIELGINLIDTAEIYSSGRSEEVVADAIKDVRKDVFVASKVSADNLHHDDVIKACKATLARLGTSYVDLYQVHWPNPKIPIRETMSAMEELVRDGSIRYIGVSNFNVAETEEASQALTKNEIVSNQVEYSLSSRSAEAEILPYCVRAKMTLIAYSPLARGQIARSVQDSILRKYKMSPAQVMLNWVTRNDQVVAIPKATNILHLEENASSISFRFTAAEYDLLSEG